MSTSPVSSDPAALAGGLLALLGVDGALVSVKQADTGAYLWANAAMLAFLGASEPDTLVGRTDLQLLPLVDAQAMKAADLRALAAGQPAADEHRFERGEQALEYRSWRIVLAPEGQGSQLLTVWWDHGQARQSGQRLKAALDQIERQQGEFEQLRRDVAAGVDRPLDLFRREHFEEHLRREVALSQREQREFALLLLSVDRVDRQLATEAPALMPRVAESISQILRGNTRAMDVLAQLGDDRYAVLLSGVGLATAHSRAEHLRRTCATQLVVQSGHSFGFEVSVGVASFPHTADALDALSQAAIRALFDARQRGGNRVALATISLADQQPR
ncbi:diguanylate cyclase (GGDEF)-like protein [Sphaerotilus hippei]|uniref:Diguanylate cyclase (GGDEF)-like protein n=1 Tax=Sphaerotilus hippei TaxID=744406 RepID=A0A318GVE4_9BURK|nr:sensor domain-containing diguanylate cyclase [Sphaerotilus hippei]PXW93286.1 diguanylate cyclase (GGDEF)-like protein [Sphaerotilus hippei]